MKVEHPQYREGAAEPSSANSSYADVIPSNRYLVGNKNSQFLYDQESEGPYQEMSKGASLNNKYLQKLASDKKTSKFRPVDTATGVIAGGLASAPLALGTQITGASLLKDSGNDGVSDLGTVRKMMRDNKLNTTFNTRDHALKKDMPHTGAKGNGIMRDTLEGLRGKVAPSYVHSQAFGGKKNHVAGVRDNGHYGMFKPKVIKNKDIIMHELGHAKDFSRFGKAKTMSVMGSRLLGGPAAVAALSHDDTRDYAAGISAAAQVPTLRSEAAANYHAYKGIKAHKGASAANKFVKTIVTKNTGNYWLNAGGKVLGTYVAAKTINSLKDAK